MRSASAIIETIRSALAELDGHPEADHVYTVLWRHLAGRRAEIGFGRPTEKVPTRAPGEEEK